jgi:hypothetical protein
MRHRQLDADNSTLPQRLSSRGAAEIAPAPAVACSRKGGAARRQDATHRISGIDWGRSGGLRDLVFALRKLLWKLLASQDGKSVVTLPATGNRYKKAHEKR